MKILQVYMQRENPKMDNNRNRSYVISNGYVITSHRIIPGGSILIKNGIIEAISETKIDAPDATIIDAKGRYIAPGFIDIHIHGGGGSDFMDGTVEAYLDRKSTRLNSSHVAISYAVFCMKKKKIIHYHK